MKITTPITDKKVKAKKKKPRKKVAYDGSKFPFRILGLSDDSVAYFIGRNDRFIEYPVSALNKNLLIRLAPVEWWRKEFGHEGKLSWDYPLDFVVDVLSKVDFDPTIICGRGAWTGKRGEMCYHDGLKTTGKQPHDKLFLRKSRKDIGILGDQITKDITTKITEIVSKMSFETPSDAIRTLGWSVLAPFAGALPWRPAGLITGPSGSGKSSVIEHVIKPLAIPKIFSGGYTTEAGIRQHIKNDATAIVIEESETDTRKKKELRDDLFSLMRQSTSDKAPKVAKGTKDGRGNLYSMRSMFLFAAISPEIQAIADDNRLFRINMVKTNGVGWGSLRDDLIELITEDNCNKIRAFVWHKLKDIIKFARKLAPMIQEITKTDTRYGLADGMLLSAYWIIWRWLDMSEEQIINGIKMFYEMQPAECQRNETDEMIDRLLDEKVYIDQPNRMLITLREILIAVHSNKLEGCGYIGNELSDSISSYLRKTAGRYGLGVTGAGDIAIASNHHEIIKITGKGRGYQRELYRHNNLVERQRAVNLSGKTRRCVIIGGVL